MIVLFLSISTTTKDFFHWLTVFVAKALGVINRGLLRPAEANGGGFNLDHSLCYENCLVLLRTFQNIPQNSLERYEVLSHLNAYVISLNSK